LSARSREKKVGYCANTKEKGSLVGAGERPEKKEGRNENREIAIEKEGEGGEQADDMICP